MSLRTSPPAQNPRKLTISSSNRALPPSGGRDRRPAVRALGFALAGRILGQARLSV